MKIAKRSNVKLTPLGGVASSIHTNFEDVVNGSFAKSQLSICKLIYLVCCCMADR